MSDHYESIRDALKENQPTKALEHAQIFAKSEPDNPFPHRVTIEILNKLGRHLEADEYAAVVLPKHADPSLHLSFAAGAAQAQNWEEADRRFSQVIARFPDFPGAYNAWFSAFVARGDVASGEQLLSSVLDRFVGDVWVFHNWAQAAVLRGDFRTGAVRFGEVSLRFPEHLAAFYEASRCYFQLREFAAAHAFGIFVPAPSDMAGVERSTLFAFIGALHHTSDSTYGSTPENECDRLLALGQSCLSAGKPELALQAWSQCRVRDTTGIAAIGTTESLIRLGHTYEAIDELVHFIGGDREFKLSHILIPIVFELCGSLYVTVLQHQGEIPPDVFDCLSKVVKFTDDLLQSYPSLENMGNLEWLRNSVVTLFRGSVYRPYVRDFSDLRSLYAGIRSNAFRNIFSSFCKLLDGSKAPAFSPPIGGASTRIAVLLCGQDRGYEQSLTKLREFLGERSVSVIFVTWNRSGLRLPTPEPDTIGHLVRIFPHATVDIIAKCGPAAAVLFAKLVAFRALFEEPLVREEISRKTGADCVEVEDELEFEKTYHDKIARLAERFGSLGQHTTAMNSAKMVYLNKRAWQVLEHFEEMSGSTFNTILRMRPDLLLSSKYKLIDLEHMIRTNERLMLVDQRQDHVVIQSGDRLSFSSRDAMRVYCDLWDRWDRYAEGSGEICHITAPHNRIVDFMLEQDIPLKLLEGVAVGYDASRRFDHSQLRAALTMDLDSGRLTGPESETVRKMIASLELS
jgi:tetratricopeptide (TPR) repeat protein